MRKRKIWLEDLIDQMIGRLYKARSKCHSPGDKFAIDLFLDIRDDARRCVRVSRSRLFAAVRGGYAPGDNDAGDSDRRFIQSEFLV